MLLWQHSRQNQISKNIFVVKGRLFCYRLQNTQEHTVNYTKNVSPPIAAAMSVLLIQQGVVFRATPVDGPSAKRQVDIDVPNDPTSMTALDIAYRKASEATVTIETGIDSDEQASNYMNGTLSNLSPGVAVTLQISPVKPYRDLKDSEAAKILQSLLLPVAAQGWCCLAVLGEDVDNPG